MKKIGMSPYPSAATLKKIRTAVEAAGKHLRVADRLIPTHGHPFRNEKLFLAGQQIDRAMRSLVASMNSLKVSESENRRRLWEYENQKRFGNCKPKVKPKSRPKAKKATVWRRRKAG